MVPDDYIHRVGRTARAGAEGDAWVLASPGEERALVQIERQIGLRLPRITLPDFDYAKTTLERPDRREHRPRRPTKQPPRPIAPPSRGQATSSPAGSKQPRRRRRGRR